MKSFVGIAAGKAFIEIIKKLMWWVLQTLNMSRGGTMKLK